MMVKNRRLTKPIEKNNSFFLLSRNVILAILFFLIVIAWLRSGLSMAALPQTNIYQVALEEEHYLFVEYPKNILYDSQNINKLILWISGNPSWFNQQLTISSNNKSLFFAIQSEISNRYRWRDTLEIILPAYGRASTILFKSSAPTQEEPQIIFSINGTNLNTADLARIKWESEADVRKRYFLTTILDTSLVASVLVGAFTLLIQARRDDEENRKIEEEYSNIIKDLPKEMEQNFSEALDKYINMIEKNFTS